MYKSATFAFFGNRFIEYDHGSDVSVPLKALETRFWITWIIYSHFTYSQSKSVRVNIFKDENGKKGAFLFLKLHTRPNPAKEMLSSRCN